MAQDSQEREHSRAREAQFDATYPPERSFWADSFLHFSFGYGVLVGAISAGALALFLASGSGAT